MKYAYLFQFYLISVSNDYANFRKIDFDDVTFKNTQFDLPQITINNTVTTNILPKMTGFSGNSLPVFYLQHGINQVLTLVTIKS